MPRDPGLGLASLSFPRAPEDYEIVCRRPRPRPYPARRAKKAIPVVRFVLAVPRTPTTHWYLKEEMNIKVDPVVLTIFPEPDDA